MPTSRAGDPAQLIRILAPGAGEVDRHRPDMRVLGRDGAGGHRTCAELAISMIANTEGRQISADPNQRCGRPPHPSSDHAHRRELVRTHCSRSAFCLLVSPRFGCRAVPHNRSFRVLNGMTFGRLEVRCRPRGPAAWRAFLHRLADGGGWRVQAGWISRRSRSDPVTSEDERGFCWILMRSESFAAGRCSSRFSGSCQAGGPASWSGVRSRCAG
jgi:hypothetical protein